MLVSIWMFAAAVGGGLAVLRYSGLISALTQGERIAIAFVLGVGIIGWLAFFPGVLGFYTPLVFAVLLGVLTLGLTFVRTSALPSLPESKPTVLEWVLIIGISLVIAMDLFEALAPAADADSMAYHFETPRRFLAEHTVFAIPRAIDGITQLLLQLTYGVALGLGGKAAVPLWSMLSGWGLGAVFYVLARRHMERVWALAGTLLLMSTPAIVYAAGTGQVEVRNAAFAMLAAYAAAIAVQTSDNARMSHRWTLIAGLAAGFFIGAKLTGLIFATALAIALVGRTGSLRRMLLFTSVAALAGGQWYVFNWVHTGDPVYPMLWRFVTLEPGFEWDAGMADNLRNMWQSTGTMPRSILWLLAYPFRTIVAPLPEFESLRIGLGPTALVLAPFAAIAAFRDNGAWRSPLCRVLTIAVLFYVIWFFITPSTFVRHLIPVYPLIMLCIWSGLGGYAAAFSATRPVLVAGLAALIAIQISGQLVFTKKFADYLFFGESATAYMQRNVAGYDAVSWVNDHLTKNDRVLVTNREWLYLLNVPYFMAHPALQKRVDIRPGSTNLRRFVDALSATRITHAIVQEASLSRDSKIAVGRFFFQLARHGCAVPLARIEALGIQSRTLPALKESPKVYVIFKVDTERCS